MSRVPEVLGCLAISAGRVTLTEQPAWIAVEVDRLGECKLDADRARHLARALNRMAKRLEARLAAEPQPVRKAA